MRIWLQVLAVGLRVALVFLVAYILFFAFVVPELL